MTDTGAGFGHPSKIHFSCSKDNLNVANIQHAPLVGYLYLRSLAIQKIPSFISSPSSPLNSTSPRRALYTTSWRCCCLPSSDFHTLIPFISWNFHATTDLFILSSPVLRSRTNHSKRLEFSHKETKKDKKESPFFSRLNEASVETKAKEGIFMENPGDQPLWHMPKIWK